MCALVGLLMFLPSWLLIGLMLATKIEEDCLCVKIRDENSNRFILESRKLTPKEKILMGTVGLPIGIFWFLQSLGNRND